MFVSSPVPLKRVVGKSGTDVKSSLFKSSRSSQNQVAYSVDLKQHTRTHTHVVWGYKRCDRCITSPPQISVCELSL